MILKKQENFSENKKFFPISEKDNQIVTFKKNH
jgi:hypothetical protein